MATKTKPFENFLKKQETTKDKNGGWDAKKKEWKPITVNNEKVKTIAYGHQLTEQETKDKSITLPDGTVVDLDKNGLTDAQALSLLDNDIKVKTSTAKKQWELFRTKGFEDAIKNKDLSDIKEDLKTLPTWESIPANIKITLVNIAFNEGDLTNNKTGKFDWPKLAAAIKREDIPTIKEQAITTAPGVGKLTRRSKALNKLIDMKASEITDIEQVTTPSTTSQVKPENAVQSTTEAARGQSTGVVGDTEEDMMILNAFGLLSSTSTSPVDRTTSPPITEIGLPIQTATPVADRFTEQDMMVLNAFGLE